MSNDDLSLLAYADAEYDTEPCTSTKRNTATAGYAELLADYATSNTIQQSTVEFMPGALPVITGRRVPQCGASTSSTNTESECTTVRKVDIPSFQHKSS